MLRYAAMVSHTHETMFFDPSRNDKRHAEPSACPAAQRLADACRLTPAQTRSSAIA
ncbi:hypothetical protein DB30_04069 [Enhygromyxa salina]|uniref:Uncharacterized protein n=1 Tax=Enhygromyxa salina TaxID=215803 RepID=A0A0C2DAJ3_9BACT|nr:hypothetical protein DB30_04069 [Enhygromyxa salina]